MSSKLSCTRSYLAVIGCILQDINLLGDLDRQLDRSDFNTDNFYELMYSAMYNLYEQGCKKIEELAIDSYLSAYPTQYKIFKENNGLDYLMNARSIADLTNYNYYYHRLRKYSLLRYYEINGLDTKHIYNPEIVDVSLSEKEQEKFDAYTEQDIIDKVSNALVTKPSMTFCSNAITTDVLAGSGMLDLVNSYMETPDIGIPFNSYAFNTITRGARKGCLYMRSAGSSVGKSRLAAADACQFSVPYRFNLDTGQWDYTNLCEPTVYITTEMKIDEVQTMFLAYVSGVNEEHIINGTYDNCELERVIKASEYIEASPLYITHIPDFSIEDIENIIKRYKREYGVEYFFFDYIHSSLKLMSEIGGKAHMKLQEHQLLLVFVTRLKALCQQHDVFVMTASQLSGDYDNMLIKDQNCLAGAKGMAFKLDCGVICTRPTVSELKRIQPILAKQIAKPIPNLLTWVYKVRRGKITRVVIWSYIDLGTMSTRDLFVTNTNFELIDVDFTKIEHVEQILKENSIDIKEALKEEPVYVQEEEMVEEMQTNNSLGFSW